MNDTYEAVIGLEIHAELATETKMFCRCKNDPFHAEPNTHVCPVCLGLPGALPVMNKKAVDATILVGLALHCKINEKTKWDRKNYFYPDLPKGYQISQYDLPLCYEGKMSVKSEGEDFPVEITRIHLEEDTGTLQHPAGAAHSLVSYNRSGVPLMELVTEPDFRTGKQVRLFAEEYQRILRALGVATADMEKGEMRVEANISVRTKEQSAKGEYGTKVEVKNLNSFRSAERAIDFEIERQIKQIENGEKVIQETRGWNDTKQITFSQRVKEGAADYRYFPEPDLPPLSLSKEYIEELRATMPPLPAEKRLAFIELGLTEGDAEVMVNDAARADYFAQILSGNIAPKLAANWVINEVADMAVSAERLIELLKTLESGDISSKIAKDILVEMKTSDKTASQIIEDKGLKQVSDTDAIEAMVQSVLDRHPNELAAYKAGKEALFGFFVGQVMREAKGQANPQVLNELLKKKLA
jgi:aspartyl-tRNA(Asn)/glutamyl-tRNA(Gln) amidotransferase subunit B